MDKALIVLDVGKTHSKLSLLDPMGSVLATRARANEKRIVGGRAVLDTDGIEVWLLESLAELAKLATVGAIIPVGHGATAALVADDRLAAPVLDYEAEPPEEIAREYDGARDPFELTLSPRLPQGLNLGVQLWWQEKINSSIWPSVDLLLWPQYWAWRLCGERAAEVTSLGCHTDLWFPGAQRYSDLAVRKGWNRKFGAPKPANAPLGTVRAEIARLTGISPDCEVLCGIHDSNAALNAARGAGMGDTFVLVSTGTWFVAMQSGAGAIPKLDSCRDTLANVDWEGRPVPSARFMGGREYAAIMGEAMGAVPSRRDAEKLVVTGRMTRPSFVRGSGPFPASEGAIGGTCENDSQLAALASLHLALMTDASLDLISGGGPILIEGRFADDPVFPAALAALRPHQDVFTAQLADGVMLGAVRLKYPELRPNVPMAKVTPLDADLQLYRRLWHDNARR